MNITGKITLDDGSTSEFSIDPESGWQQWAAVQDRLGRTVGLMEALQAAVADEYEGLRAESMDDLRAELRELEGEGEFREIPVGYVDGLTDEQVRERVAELRGDDD